MIRVETPIMTVAELTEHIGSANEPVRRSTHVGNQPSMELTIMAALPMGVDVLMVDTIQGNDKYSQPNTVIGRAAVERLVSNRKADKRVVGSLRGEVEGAQVSLIDIHQGALDSLQLNNRPVLMMKYFAAHPELLGAAMEACEEMGEVTRFVDTEGLIHQSHEADKGRPIFGNASDHGRLLPLNGMMTMDALISHSQQSPSTLHLAGPDMVRYVRNPERMSRVSELFGRACALLALKSAEHNYRVLDTHRLAILPVRSQHELLESGQIIDISGHLEVKLGDSDD